MPETGTSIDTFPLDPLRYGCALPLRRLYSPMGFPVALTTNHESVLRAAAEVWGKCGNKFDCPPVELRFAVDEHSSSPRPPAILPSGQAHLLSVIHSAENFAVADLSLGFAFGWLTPSVVADSGYFRYHFLEPLAYLMLGSLYLTPVHAACIALDGAGVLLCGDSGAGKTSLAYACARQGWTYVADDASHLVRPGVDRQIAGRPHQIRFRSSASTLFPELAAYPAVQRASGKLDIEVETAKLGLRSIATHTRADYIVFLNRHESPCARLAPVTRESAYRRLSPVLCFGEESVREQQRDALRNLLKAPVVELQYRELQQAEQLLGSLVRNGA